MGPQRPQRCSSSRRGGADSRTFPPHRQGPARFQQEASRGSSGRLPPLGCVLRLQARGHSLPLHDCGFWSHHSLCSWPTPPLLLWSRRPLGDVYLEVLSVTVPGPDGDTTFHTLRSADKRARQPGPASVQSRLPHHGSPGASWKDSQLLWEDQGGSVYTHASFNLHEVGSL